MPHTFWSRGNQGPDLTGTNRGDLDYLLLHVSDPSATVGEPYRTVVVKTTSQRTISGVVVAEDETSLHIKTATETHLLSLEEVAERRQLTSSAMPEGLLTYLEEAQLRDLVAYLQGKEQVPYLSLMKSLSSTAIPAPRAVRAGVTASF